MVMELAEPPCGEGRRLIDLVRSIGEFRAGA